MERGRRLCLGVFILVLVDFIWVASSELSEYVFKNAGYNKPFFSTYVKTSMFVIYLLGFIFLKPWRQSCGRRDDIVYQVIDMNGGEDELLSSDERRLSEPRFEPLKTETGKSSDADLDDSSVKSVRFSKLAEVRQMSEEDAIEAMLSRLSFTASARAERNVRDASLKMSVREVMKISLIFCLLWFMGNYGYQIALSQTEAGVVNVISTSSGLFTLILAAIFPAAASDRFTFSKLVVVLVMVAGMALVSYEDINLEGLAFPLGVLWSLVGAVMYACYMVFLRRQVPSEEQMDFTMFFGFVGLFNMLLLWPGFPLLHLLGWETFQVPNWHQVMYMSINGLVGTVLSELLWLWGCFLTSSLMATLSLSLTIPLTMIVDVMLKGIKYSWWLYLGSVPMVAAFVAVTLLTHFESWDPVGSVMHAFCTSCRKRCRHRITRDDGCVVLDVDELEREGLMMNGSMEFDEDDEVELDTTTTSALTNHI